jgi:hypothetical protein
MKHANKSRAMNYVDESCNATESSSMASSFDESDTDALNEDRWLVSSSKTKPLLSDHSESTRSGSMSVTAGERATHHIRSNDYPSGNAIRSRLLNKLGFEPAASKRPKSSAISPTPSLHESNAFFVDLKGDYGVPEKSSVSKQDRSVNSKRRIVFNPEVKVQTIPSHADFSDRIRRVMWTDAVEMDENAARNCLEYTAEGWDWRNVLVDEDMILINGEKIHPVHFADEEYNLNRELSSILSSHLQ